MTLRIAIGADPYGLGLKEHVKRHLAALGHDVTDAGGDAARERPYFEVAHDVARAVGTGEVERGILFCGSGMGMAIVANKVKGVYAALCEDVTAAQNARAINDANVLALGGLVTAAERARLIVDAFLDTSFGKDVQEPLRSFLAGAVEHVRRIEDEEFRERG